MKFHFDSYVKNWKKKKPKTEEAKEVDLFEEEPEEKPEDKAEENKPEDGAEPDAKKPKVEIEDPEEENEKLEEILRKLSEEEKEAETNNPVKMYENLNIFVREDGDTPEDQILGLKSNDKVHSLEKYIQELDFADEMWRELYVLNEQLTRRFINVVDIVRTSSSRSICFTKAYGKYAQGTGSMIDMLEKEPLNQSAESSKERIPENYQLRYFTEMEVAGLMGFPKCFSFPSELTTRQRYAMLGNSLNVNVAAMMIKLMVLGDDEGKLSAAERAEYEKLKAEFES